jgi:signal transduction histidine kinase
MNHQSKKSSVAGFRTKLFAALMLIIICLTGLGLFFGQRKIAADVETDLQQNFQAELTAMHKLHELRDSALAERCRVLGEKPRIHAALEDNALDLLYVSAKDELRDLMQRDETSTMQSATSLHATFYRFLDANGAVLPAPNPKDFGELNSEAQLNLKKLPTTQQIGYVAQDGANKRFDEVIAIPIFSTETSEVISALVVGFKPFELSGKGMQSGIWTNEHLHFPSLPVAEQASLAKQIANVFSRTNRTRNNFTVTVNRAPQLLFYKQLNPDSIFPPAYEICVYPLANSIAQLHRLRWQVGSAGVLLLLGGFVVTRFTVARLSRPVEQLAIESEHAHAEREKAETALASATEELERSTRYSADASHQLKSPVTILRAGLETLLSREDFASEVYEELSGLLHQTHRLTGVIDDLLLLARMDAGHLEIKAESVNLSQLVEEWLDDLSALPDAPEVTIEKDIPSNLYVAGERRYTSLVVQNVLENARKYNRPGGRLRVIAREGRRHIVVTVGNSGRTIPRSEQDQVFERFHRNGRGSAVSGHGLGLNLARELARLQGGELRLIQSENDWTEFELRFRIARTAAARSPQDS